MEKHTSILIFSSLGSCRYMAARWLTVPLDLRCVHDVSVVWRVITTKTSFTQSLFPKWFVHKFTKGLSVKIFILVILDIVKIFWIIFNLGFYQASTEIELTGETASKKREGLISLPPDWTEVLAPYRVSNNTVCVWGGVLCYHEKGVEVTAPDSASNDNVGKGQVFCNWQV